MRVGGEHADGEHRFEQDDPGGPSRVFQRQRTRGLEGDVGGVHGVRLAVHQANPDVDKREAGGDPEVELAPHAPFHRRDELTRDRTADDLVAEFPSESRR